MAKEIWFECIHCGQESYCDAYFDDIPEADVMCPFCLERMKLEEARLDHAGVRRNKGQAIDVRTAKG